MCSVDYGNTKTDNPASWTLKASEPLNCRSYREEEKQTSDKSGQKTEGCSQQPCRCKDSQSVVGVRVAGVSQSGEWTTVKPKPRLLQSRPALEQFATFSRTNKLQSDVNPETEPVFQIHGRPHSTRVRRSPWCPVMAAPAGSTGHRPSSAVTASPGPAVQPWCL